MSFSISSSVNNGYPYQSTTGLLVEVFTGDVPNGLYTQRKGKYPLYRDVSSKLVIVFQSPLPSGMFLQNSGTYPARGGDTIVPVGVCLGCSSLTSVTFPKSIKRISNYSFWGTMLRTVTIPSDCVYYEHSFPEECVISYYEE